MFVARVILTQRHAACDSWTDGRTALWVVSYADALWSQNNGLTGFSHIYFPVKLQQAQSVQAYSLSGEEGLLQ